MGRIKIYTFFTLLMLAVAFALELLTRAHFPEFCTMARFAIPLYFWVLYSLLLLVKPSANNASFTKYFMFFKSVKLLLSLMFIFLLAFIVRKYAVGLVINFFIYYMILLLAESAFAIYIKKRC